MAKNPKRPRDPNQLGKLIADIATGEAENTKPQEKDPAAVALGRKGGQSRAKSLTPEERKAIAEKAAKKRWEED
ncbi:MAG: histone H1 [Alphaproteobacteria bacterium]|nr:histone H1 [Alphaproteobacteria bacterium]